MTDSLDKLIGIIPVAVTAKIAEGFIPKGERGDMNRKGKNIFCFK